MGISEDLDREYLDFAGHLAAFEALLASPRSAKAAAQLVERIFAAPEAALQALEKLIGSAPGESQDAHGFSYHNLSQPVPPFMFARPERVADLEELVRDAVAAGRRVKALGDGWGFSNAASTDGYMIDLRGLNKVLPIDQTVTDIDTEPLLQFEAGATIDMLNAAIPDNLALVNQPGFEELTFLGTSAVGGHGSGLRFPALSDSIRSLRLLRVSAEGALVWTQVEPSRGITRADAFKSKYPEIELIQDDRVFAASIVAMGSLGIVYSLTIALRPARNLRETRVLADWNEVRELLPSLVQDTKFHSVAIWVNPYPIDRRQTCVIGKYEETDEERKGQRPPAMTDVGGSLVLERIVVWLLNNVQGSAPAVIDAALRATLDSDVIMSPPLALNFGAPNRLRVKASAVGVPLAATPAVVERLTGELSARADAGHWLGSALGLRFVPSARGLLAPQSGRDTCMIEVPCLAGIRRSVDTILACHRLMVDEFAGRPHWGQLNPLSKAQVRLAYGDNFRTFKRHFEALNPHRTFDNALTDQLGLRDLD